MKSILFVVFVSLLTACGGGDSSGLPGAGNVNVTERSGNNDSSTGAQVVTLNDVIQGQLTEGVDMADVYELTLSSDGGEVGVTYGGALIVFTLEGSSNTDFDLNIVDEYGSLIRDSNGESSSEYIKTILNNGTYFIEVENAGGTGDYILDVGGALIEVVSRF